MKKRRLLLVDDDRQMVRTLSDIFAMHGWEVVPAYSGREAVEAAEAHPFDVVLMDIMMPGMNGVEALTAMRRTSPGTRVVLMTAYSADELIDQALRSGAGQVLSKPVMIPELLAYLDQGGEGRHSVLVVDDDDDFRSTLLEALRGHGHDAAAAADLDEAIAALERGVPDVVVLDPRLGAPEPRDAVLAVRQTDPSVVIILCSGHAALLDETELAVPPNWVFARLRKPFPPARLLEMLDAV